MKPVTSLFATICLLVCGICHAQGLLHVFQSGEPALASEVNANFAYLAPKSIVLVGPVEGGTAVDNGDALRNAMLQIASVNGSPSADNPYLLKLAPGVYDLGTTPLQLRSFVQLEGCGPAITRITSQVAEMASGTLLGVNDSVVRQLTVENSHAGSFAVAVYAGGAEMLLEDVALRATGASNNRALSTNNGTVTLRRAAIEVSGGSLNYGVYNWIAPKEVLEDVTITISSPSSASNYGLWSSNANLELRRVRIFIDGGSSASNYGIYNTTESYLFMYDSSIYLDGISGSTYHCIHLAASAFETSLERVTMDVQQGSGDDKAGIFNLSPVLMRIYHCRIMASDSIHSEAGTQVKVAHSQVAWYTPGGGSVQCHACYDASFVLESCQ